MKNQRFAFVKPASKCEQLAAATALEIWVEAKGPNSIMIPCPPFFPHLASQWMIDTWMSFTVSGLVLLPILLCCFVIQSPFCMWHHEEQQAEVASSLSRTHGIEMKAASMKWISLLRKSHTSWFGLTFSTVTRKKKQNVGSTSKAKHMFFSSELDPFAPGAHEGNPINSGVFHHSHPPSRVSAWSHFFCVISTPRRHLVGGVGEDLVYPRVFPWSKFTFDHRMDETPRSRPQSFLVPWNTRHHSDVAAWDTFSRIGKRSQHDFGHASQQYVSTSRNDRVEATYIKRFTAPIAFVWCKTQSP